MTGKRKASDDAPGSAGRRQREAGNYDEDSSSSRDYSEDVSSDGTTLSDDDERSSLGDYHVGGGDSNGESQIADLIAFLNLPQFRDVHTETKVQPPPPPPPADHPKPAKVDDQSVAAGAPAQEVVVPAAESAMCFG